MSYNSPELPRMPRRPSWGAMNTTKASLLLMTLEQVAEQLQIEPRTVRKLCARGDLEYVKIGPKTLRFKPEWIDQMIQRKQGR
jgi:excisionase family DNA binding protein